MSFMGAGRTWSLLTTHGHVLVEIARDPAARMHDIATTCDITEAAAQAVLADLVAAGYLVKPSVPSHDRFALHPRVPFRVGPGEYAVWPSSRFDPWRAGSSSW